MKNIFPIILLTLLITGCKITAITIELNHDPVKLSEATEENENIE